MYAILSGGVLLALCDKPRYVKVNEASGAYVEAEEAEAVGVSICGDLYNLVGGTAIPDAPGGYHHTQRHCGVRFPKPGTD